MNSPPFLNGRPFVIASCMSARGSINQLINGGDAIGKNVANKIFLVKTKKKSISLSYIPGYLAACKQQILFIIDQAYEGRLVSSSNNEFVCLNI